MKTIRYVSIFLGISMFMFGILKFFNPFKTWYAVQISASGLGELAYWSGIAGEITVGIVLLALPLNVTKITGRLFFTLVGMASFALAVMMGVGIFVHLQPDVPADVLPLKIKPPFIPGIFLAVALMNGIMAATRVGKTY